MAKKNGMNADDTSANPGLQHPFVAELRRYISDYPRLARTYKNVTISPGTHGGADIINSLNTPGREQ